MLRSESVRKPELSVGGRRCNHRSLAVVFTELGCHARCLRCGNIGPERPSSKAARQALLVLGAYEGGGYYG
jgi:hypothetical protein